MKHRTTRGVAALALGAALVLSGCGSDSDAPADDATTTATDPTADVPEASPEDIAALEAVTITGDAGSEPTVEFETPFEVSATVAILDTPGTGADLEDGQKLSIDYVSYNGADGEKNGSTWEGGTPDSITLGDQSIFPQLNEVLSGQQIGARIVFANPVDMGDGTSSVELLVVEVSDAQNIPDRAEGEAVEPEDGLPTVTLGEDGTPSIEIPEGYEAPDELIVQPLITGDGAEVTEEQTVTAHYTGWTFDGEVFDSSWERGTPTDFPLTGVIAGWTQGIAGQTVGSQVLLVIPSDLAYGADGTPDGSIAPDSPLIFVVDILAAQ
ncbi:FKBP-type peptidyl-prolyl cis-trans isomerase [Oerskovia flava]|uniref:FKBP-type peptidyl-prolyl cis-trans isomerase n=1 Tax=Oerskovia flava TaxID=2986422 RepID=UPI00223FC5D6|nr:FKBP-type peptidyl-prolyl cis-trans isomerase [Oerskovia sp. JB1-3-2]